MSRVKPVPIPSTQTQTQTQWMKVKKQTSKKHELSNSNDIDRASLTMAHKFFDQPLTARDTKKYKEKTLMQVKTESDTNTDFLMDTRIE